MSTTPVPSLWVLPEVRFAGAVGLVSAATVLSEHRVALGTGGLVLGAVVAGASLTLPARYAAALGLAAWAFLTGFLVNVGGQLTFTGDDVRRAAVLVSVALLVSRAARFARVHPVEAPSLHTGVRAGVRAGVR